MNTDVYLVQKLHKNTYDSWSTAYISRVDAIKEARSRIVAIALVYGYTDPSNKNYVPFLRIKQEFDNGNANIAIDMFNNICVEYKINFFPVSCIGLFNEMKTWQFETSKAEEIECRVCNRKNDKGITVCWNCGNIP